MEPPGVFWNSKQSGGQIQQGFLLRMRQLDLHFRENPLATACWEGFSWVAIHRSLNQGGGNRRSGRSRGGGAVRREMPSD